MYDLDFYAQYCIENNACLCTVIRKSNAQNIIIVQIPLQKNIEYRYSSLLLRFGIEYHALGDIARCIFLSLGYCLKTIDCVTYSIQKKARFLLVYVCP